LAGTKSLYGTRSDLMHSVEQGTPSLTTSRYRRLWFTASRHSSWVVAVVVTVVVVAPVIALVAGAFSTNIPTAPDAHWTLSNVKGIFSGLVGHQTLVDAGHSIELSLITTVLAVGFGGTIAWFVVRTDIPGARVFRRTFMFPLFYSIILNIVGWIMLAETSSGYINVFWRYVTGSSGHLVNIYSLPGMAWIMGLFFMPFAMIMIANSLERGNASLEESAAVAGAGPFRRFWSITVPMARPGILAAVLFVFALSLEDFVTPLFIGAQIHFGTLSLSIYEFVEGYPSSPSEGAAVSILLIVLTTLGLVFYRRLTRQEKKFVSVGGKGQRPPLISLGKWRWASFSAMALILLVTIVAPLVAVILRAFMAARTSSLFSAHFDFQNFTSLGSSGTFTESLRNSLILSIAGATVCAALGIFLAHWIVRRRNSATALVDYMISLPLGIPGIAFGLGMLWAFVATPVYLTLWILLIAYSLRYAVYGVRTISSGLLQIDPSLEEAAMVCGATRLQTSRWIDAPLLKTALASSWTLVFLLVLQELSATIILYGVATTTLSVAIFNNLDSGFYGPASALAVVQLTIVAILVSVFSAVFRVRLSEGVSS
jgi:iron(III) transport system permease protein